MKATNFEFRFRFFIHAILVTLGFSAPWNFALHIDPPGTNSHVWGLLATKIMLGTMTAFNLLLVLAILFALFAALLRLWGTAYIGTGIVQSVDMHGSAFLADGPYRHMRNPLYVGTFLHCIALALPMPPSGAIFTIVTIGLFQLRLILAEESFLTAKLGQPYLDYCKRVPRIFPSPTPRVPASGASPHWLQAVLGEIYMIGVAVSFAVFGWSYSAFLLMKCVLISLGVSLIVRAAMPSPKQDA